MALTLVPFVKWGGEYPASALRASKLFAVLLVVAVGIAAWRLGGALSSACAALILGLSPFPRSIGSVTMSDGLEALLAVACLALLVRPNRISTALAGVLSGWSVLVRLAGVLVVGAMALALAPRRLMWVGVAAAAPFVVALLAYQAVAFGGPLTSGVSYYYPDLKEFSASYVAGSPSNNQGIVPDQLHGAALRPLCHCASDNLRHGDVPNVLLYGMMLAGGVWVFAPPLLPLIGAWELVRRRNTEAARYGLAVVLGTLVLYLPYYYQDVRFLAPAAAVLVVYSGVGIGRFAGNLANGRGRIREVLAYGFAAPA
jgi:4-amino-4-deoxy-L-arabinose transferase-like glycosyltransferase